MKKTTKNLFCINLFKILSLLFCFPSLYLQGQTYSWQDPKIKILPSGDLEWAPKAYQYTAGASVRYIDFEGGNDTNTGADNTSAWKHHPWDANATDNAKACTGIQTYVFKKGVIYRGILTAKESGVQGNPIRLVSDPSWGTGEAAIYGSQRITGGWTVCNATTAPKIPNPEKVWFKDLSSLLPATKVVCEINGNSVSRIKLARTPNWEIVDTADPLGQCWEWTGPGSAGNVAGYRKDSKNLIQSDASYYNGATVWSEYAGMMGTLWGEPLISYNPIDHIIKTQFNYGQIRDRYFIENNPHLLDTTNEYFFDKSGSFPGRLYVRLKGDKDPNTTIIEVATLEQTMITIPGMNHIVISGLTFAFNTSTAMRWGANNVMEASAISINGNSNNIEISNCKFQYLNNVICASSTVSDIYITDNEMLRIDDQAITFAPGNQKNIFILRNHLYDISGRTNSRWYSPLCAITGTFSQAEIAGNVLEMCWGSGIYMFWATGPCIRGMVHHNKVNWSLLGTCDWGALESWNGGPAYYFNNISKNPRGYKKGLNSSWGMAYYLDGGASMQYLFNNIAIGTGSDLNNVAKSSGVPYEQTTGSCNIFANNTATQFYHFSYSQNPVGNNFYIGNVCNEISKNYFAQDTKLEDVPFQSIANNVFYTSKYKPYMGFFTPGMNLFSLEDFQKGLADNNAQCSQVGWKALSPVLKSADDLRPNASGEAIDRGVKVFIPFGLASDVGIWNFFKHPADSSVIAGQNYYAGTQRNNLKAFGLTLNNFIRGNLEDWNEGALNFDGTTTYCKASTSSSLNMSTNSFILEIYFRTIKNSAGKTLISKYSGSGNGYIMDVNSTGNARMRLINSGTDVIAVASAAIINDGNWHHVLAEIDRSANLNIYVDGVLSNGAITGAMPASTVSFVNTADFTIGKDNAGNYFAGTIDFLRVSKGSFAEASTSYDELFAWEFDGPFLRDFTGNKPLGVRDAGACENGNKIGEGLKGEYFNSKNLTQNVKTTIDATINFNWGSAAPDAAMSADDYSVRWSGEVLPKYSEDYTFEVEHTDGARLWVNGRLMLDSWVDGVGKHSESIKLLANQKYDIKLEYYRNTGSSKVVLRWQSTSQPYEVIPTTQLYPPCMIDVSANNLEFGFDTSAQTVTIENAKMTLTETDKTWLHAAVVNNVLTISVAENPYVMDRTGKVSVAGCEMKTITVKQTGKPNRIKTNSAEAFAIYPNPATDLLSVETKIELSKDIFLNVYDMQGRCVLAQKVISDKTLLDISILAKGMYLISIRSNDIVYEEKLVKL